MRMPARKGLRHLNPQNPLVFFRAKAVNRLSVCVVVHEVEEWVGEGVGCEESLCLLLRMNAKESLASSECYDVEF